MISVPEALLRQLEANNVLLFIGEGILRDNSEQPFLDRLTAQLAARCGITETVRLTFPEVAQAYEDNQGRHALVQLVRDQLQMFGEEPLPIYQSIARLINCNLLVTTCLDQQLERAFAKVGRPIDLVIGSTDIAFENEHKTRLYKLRGSVERVESLILTEDDYEAFFDDQTSISVALQGYLARKTTVFLGYDLADPHFKRLYRKVIASLDKYTRRAYAVEEEFPANVSGWCRRHNIEIVEASPIQFLEVLLGYLPTQIQPASPVLQKPVQELKIPIPERPYKLLDYYEAKDASIFFGREQETYLFSSLIHAHRLVLLYGASGVGKTSLLLAGVTPRLEQGERSYKTIYVRALEDPAHVIHQTIQRQLPGTNLLRSGSLVEFLDAATKTLNGALVIILDQFEEFFIRLSQQFRAAFIVELGQVYDARDIPVKIVLSLREDWLAAVSEIEQRIPEVFRIKMRLLPLTHDQARQAITIPVERLGVRYESTLVERLLNDLIGKKEATVMPPQLQLVCGTLYEKLKAEEHLITLTVYESLGGARGILQQYLNEELARLGSDERLLARTVLEELVTSQGTKAVKTTSELALTLDAELIGLEVVLGKLVRSRLLRILEREDGGIAYELAHEYLIREIDLSPEAQARKHVEELIKQEVDNWRRFGTLLAADKLDLINKMQQVLRLSAEAQSLLLFSALQVGSEVDHWLNRIKDPERQVTVLVEAVNNRVDLIRRRALVTLGQVVAAHPETTNRQIGLVLVKRLADENNEVRNKATDVLRQVVVVNPRIAEPQVVVALTKLLADQDWDVRDRALATLRQVITANSKTITQGVIEALITQLSHEEGGVRTRAAEALVQVITINPELTPQITESLISLLTSEDRGPRAKALEILVHIIPTNSKIVSSKMVEALTVLLADEDKNVRIWGVEALGKVRIDDSEMTVQVSHALDKLMSDEDTHIRAKAEKILEQVRTANLR